MSEFLVPMRKEEWSFFDKQRSLFSSMHSEMDDEWKSFDAELDRIKRDMFKLTPMDMGSLGSGVMPSLGSSSLSSDLGSSSSSKVSKKTTTTTTKTTKMTTSSKGGADPMSSLESSFGSSMDTTFGKSSLDSKIDSALAEAGFGKGFGSSALDTSSFGSSALDTSSFGSSALDTSSSFDKYMLKVEQPFVTDMDGKKKLSLKFDMSEFKPEEISLKTVDNRLMVGAKHLEETATSKIYREFSKMYVLPVKIDPITLSSVLSRDGVLSVEAPAPDSIEAPREKILPITRLL